MIRFTDALNAWATPHFNAVLKQEIEALPIEQLPLQQCLSQGSYALDEKRSVMILSITTAGELIRIKAGILFSAMIAGCSCADDPSPIEAVNEYCELWLELDKGTGDVVVWCVDDV